MSCPSTGNYEDAFNTMWESLSNQEFVEAFSCTFANSVGGLVVAGTLVWFTVSIISYIRTGGSIAMPMVYTLIFGGAVTAQLVAGVYGFVSVLLLGGFAILAVLIARRMERP